MKLKDQIKGFIFSSGWTITRVAEELTKRNGTDWSVQNLSNKIRNESLKYTDILQIADIIGYEIVWKEKEKS